MSTVIEMYRKKNKNSADGDVTGVIRTLFPDVDVETFLSRKKKNSDDESR